MSYARHLISLVLILTSLPLLAQTLVYNIKGYTNTEEGLLTFHGLLID